MRLDAAVRLNSHEFSYEGAVTLRFCSRSRETSGSLDAAVRLNSHEFSYEGAVTLRFRSRSRETSGSLDVVRGV